MPNGGVFCRDRRTGTMPTQGRSRCHDSRAGMEQGQKRAWACGTGRTALEWRYGTHTSTSGPSYGFAFKTSGAAKYEDPRKVDKCLTGCIDLTGQNRPS